MTKSPRGAGRLDWSVLPTAARVGTGCSVKRRRRVPRGASYGIQFRPPVLQGEAWQVSPPEGDFVRVAGDFNPRRACCLAHADSRCHHLVLVLVMQSGICTQGSSNYRSMGCRA